MDTHAVPASPGLFGPVSVRLRTGDVGPDLLFTRVLQPAGVTSWNSGLSGKTTVLVFFPLISINPQPVRMWNAIVHRFASTQMQFVMITSEKESTLLPWLAQHPVNGSVLYDVEGRTGRAYGLEMPATVYIGPDGKIIGFARDIVPDERTLNAVLDGHITTTRPKNDFASVKAFLASGLVPLDGESPRMPRPEDDKPDFPPSQLLHVSPAKDEVGSRNSGGDDFWSLQGFTLKSLIAEIYRINPNRIVLPASLDDGRRYDFAVVLPEPKSREEMRLLFKQGIQGHFHITAHREARLSYVYVVTAPRGTPPLTKVRQSTNRMGAEFHSFSVGYKTQSRTDDTLIGGLKSVTIDTLDSVAMVNATLDEFCNTLELTIDRPVINHTNLKGRYDLEVRAGKGQEKTFRELLRSKLNLEVTPARRKIEALVLRPQ